MSTHQTAQRAEAAVVALVVRLVPVVVGAALLALLLTGGREPEGLRGTFTPSVEQVSDAPVYQACFDWQKTPIPCP